MGVRFFLDIECCRLEIQVKNKKTPAEKRVVEIQNGGTQSSKDVFDLDL